ncbi:MAG: translocation/assembly module TamB domain-containing protein [Elusimicrobia bacterium]|jgi:hypothetical protein|nr:translocation/assembly module TamB domain-containing protein [Elusimicrobiota bacterium]
MKRKIKIITLSLFAALILTAGIILYLKSRQFTENLKTVINKKAGEYLQNKVDIGRIYTDIFNNLVLSEVTIDNPSTPGKDIYIGKVKVNYSFIKILKNIRNVPELVSEISLYNPEFKIIKSSGGLIIPGLEKMRAGKNLPGGGKIPPWKFNVIDGDIAVVLPGSQKYRASDFNSVIMLSGYPEIYAKSDFNIEQLVRDVKVELKYHLLSKKTDIDINSAKFILNSVGEINSGFGKVSFDRGTADVSLSASGYIDSFDNILEVLDINGEIKVAGAEAGQLSVDKADINISPRRLNVGQATARWKENLLNVTGTISNYMKDPHIDFGVTGQLAARELLKQTDIKNINGIFNVEGYLRGKPGEIEASGRISMETGFVGNYKINKLNTTADISTSSIKIGAGMMEIAGGRLRWDGQWDIRDEFDVTATAEKISMRKLTGVKNINGAMSGNITVKGRRGLPEIKSEVTIDDFSVPGKKFGRVDAEFNYADSEITVNGFSIDNKYIIKGDLQFTEGTRRLDIKSFEINGAGAGAVKSTGYMRYSPFVMSLETVGTNISHLDLPGFTELYEGASGSFNFAGKLDILSDEVRIDGKVMTDNLMIDSGSYEGGVRLGYQYKEGKKVFSIDELDINNTVKGSVSISYENDAVVLNRSSVTATAADIGNILKVLKIKNDKIDGQISGEFIFSSGEGRAVFKSTGIKYADRDLGNLSSLLKYDGKHWSVEKLNLNKEKGSLNIKGKLGEKQALYLKLTSYDIFGRIFNASGNYTGAFNKDTGYKYDIKVKDFSVNGGKWPEININGTYKDSVAGSEINAGDTLSGNISLGFKNKEDLRGKIVADNFNIDNLLSLLKAAEGPAGTISDGTISDGTISGVLNISGTKKRPVYILSKSKIKGRRNGIPFEGRTDISYKNIVRENLSIENGKIIFKDVSGRIGENGIFSVTGSFGGKESPGAEFTVNDMNLKLLSPIEGIGDIVGRCNIGGRITGDIKSPVVDFNFNGENISVRNSARNAARNSARNAARESARKKEFKKLSITGARYRNRQLNLQEVFIKSETGSVSFSDARVFMDENNYLKLNSSVKFENLGVGSFALLGNAEIESEVHIDPFMVQLKLIPKNIIVNRLKINNPLEITYRKNQLNLKDREGFDMEIYFDPGGKIELAAQINRDNKNIFSAQGYFNGNEDIDGEIKANNFEINNIIRILDSPVNYWGSSDFNISVNKSTVSFKANGSVSVQNGRYKNIGIDHLNADFIYKDGELVLNNSFIRDADFVDITFAGRLGKISDMDIEIKRLSLAGLEQMVGQVDKASGYFAGKYHLSGDLSGNLSGKLSGTGKPPVITGRSELAGGRIEGKTVFDTIKDINCSMVASGSRLNIQSFNARWAPGKISGSGYFDFGKPKLEYDIIFKTVGDEGVIVKVPGLDIPQSGLFGRFLTLPTSGEPRGSIRLFTSSGESAPHATADIIMEDAQFTYPPSSRGEDPFSADFLDNIFLDIDLAAGKSVWYENTYARLKLAGKINFSKTPREPLAVNGELTSSQGELAYLNRTFKIQRARLIWEDSKEYISASATTNVQRRDSQDNWIDDVVELVIPQERLANINPRFNSRDFENNKTSEESAEIAIAGVDFSELTQQERNALLRRELLRAIDANLTSPLVKNILSKTAIIDVAKIDVGLSEEQPDGSVVIEDTGLELGSYLTDKLYMGYYMQMGPGIENKLRLSHELDILYRLQENQFIRGEINKDRGIFLGLEHRIKF